MGYNQQKPWFEIVKDGSLVNEIWDSHDLNSKNRRHNGIYWNTMGYNKTTKIDQPPVYLDGHPKNRSGQ